MLGHSDYDGGVALHILIESVIDNYEQDREEYWKSEGEEGYLSVVDGIANSVVRASYQLTEPESPAGLPLTWEQSRKLAEIEGLREHVLEKIQVAVAWEFANETDAMAKRCLEVTTEVLQQPPAEPVLRFLRRVTRCYVAGFYPETVILCRAVLENALAEKYEREKRPFPTVPSGKSEMSARLEKAEALGWLSRRARNGAWTVWKRGSKTVHEDPTVTAAALETIQMTMALLAELYAGHAA